MARNNASATATIRKPARKTSKRRLTSVRASGNGAVRKAAKAVSRAAARLAGKRVYFFASGKAEGGRGDKQLLGGKGANLADMTSAGLPVPPGFTITTEVCAEYYSSGQKLPRGLMDEVEAALRKVEKATGKKFGDARNPLLVSVRSGAAVSMPGMMDTILNLGMNDAVAEAMARQTGNPRFAYDSYRRLINMFGDVVMGVDHHHFEEKLAAMKQARGVANDTDLSADDLRTLAEEYKQVYRQYVGSAFPQDPMQQLEKAIEAVFRSWNTERAVKYRRLHDITGLKGTAVNVQTMVFGNMGNDSATGVAFTRNPSTGENKFYGEYLVNAQGEDVVAGIRTPKDVFEMKREMPESFAELMEVRRKLEDRYRDVQDFEFTIEQRKLYMLQTRGGKRTGVAALRIAIEMLREKMVDEKKAVQMVSPEHLDQLLHPMFVPQARQKAKVLTKGLNASPGAAVGRIAFTADEAEERVAKGEKVILVRRETEPADIGGMHVSEGILTSTGGMTSHAAVVARGMGTPCICGASEVQIDAQARRVKIGGRSFGPDDYLSIDGTTGEVLDGQLPTQEPEPDKNFKKLMALVDKFRRLKVRTNADTPEDAQRAREYGAEGIGLCRTEHMFFAPDRIGPMRQMILSNTKEGREAALRKLAPFQKKDFVGIFRAMAGLPVTIRLLDPPLHEFLPQNERDQRELAREMGLSFDDVRHRVHELHEMNPMLGHRGCRLAVTYPEILRMQVRAILEAAIEVGSAAVPEIMIPLVGFHRELTFLAEHLYDEAEKVFKEKGKRIRYLVGTMIEVPRAALVADEIAAEAEFFSFGTNDLTQMTMGFSRDDAGRFLGEYVDKGILENDPFQTLDGTGVGQLIEMSCKKGRAARANLKLGICGEHGGDPRSVHFCHAVGLDYVSCSPFRVPIARLAAAHAALRE
jgi:pyruvate,orthophosphate dikinase